jgi:hypothetical protein
LPAESEQVNGSHETGSVIKEAQASELAQTTEDSELATIEQPHAGESDPAA